MSSVLALVQHLHTQKAKGTRHVLCSFQPQHIAKRRLVFFVFFFFALPFVYVFLYLLADRYYVVRCLQLATNKFEMMHMHMLFLAFAFLVSHAESVVYLHEGWIRLDGGSFSDD